MIVCPNTSPLIVLARVERLDLLGDSADVRITRTVQEEVREKRDQVAARVEKLVAATPSIADHPLSDQVDVARALGPGERSVLSYALATGAVLCVLDDAAARTEARRLRVAFAGTLGLVLRAKAAGKLSLAAPLLRRMVDAGLYLADSTLGRALAAVGEVWPTD